MKAASLILATYVLFMSMVPLYPAVASSAKPMNCEAKKACCRMKSECSKPIEKKKNCSKEFCTPFFNCSLMHVIVQPNSSLNTFLPLLEKQFVLKGQSLFSSFVNEHWQPPEIV